MQVSTRSPVSMIGDKGAYQSIGRDLHYDSQMAPIGWLGGKVQYEGQYNRDRIDWGRVEDT